MTPETAQPEILHPNVALFQGDCLDIMPMLPDKSVDLVITSPPYDNLRTYNGGLQWGEHVWKPVIAEAYRIVKDGGVMVWVVADATIDGSETGTSFRQALWAKDCGFNLHDTMIWSKPNPTPMDWKCYRYYQAFEYMFVWSKGKPTTCNYIRVLSKTGGKPFGTAPQRRYDGTTRDDRTDKLLNTKVNQYKVKSNVWEYPIGSGVSTDKQAHQHPAIYPENLVYDHIVSWTNLGDVVLDMFAGSGTTGIAAINTDRAAILIEKEANYCDIIRNRITKHIRPVLEAPCS